MPPTIESTCPSCNSRLKAPAGVKVACPSCKAVFKMPAAVPDPPAEIFEAVVAAEDVPPPPPPVMEEAEPPPLPKPRRRLKDDEIRCRECGAVNFEDEPRCRSCRAPLRRRRRGGYDDDSGIDALIPYKNPWGLWSYYLGIFSVIPCLALLLGPAALVTGIKGVNYASANPEAKGAIHAWVGIIAGGICLLINLVIIIIFVVAAARH